MLSVCKNFSFSCNGNVMDMNADWKNDPVTTHTVLEEPYLASDGITYSKDTLLAIVKADPWHRSPVTGEVLRHHAFPNNLIQQLLGGDWEAMPRIALYDHDPLPENGGTITWVLPSLCTPRIAAFKMKWGLEDVCGDAPLALTARVLRDAGGMDWLMHAPPPEELWDDVIDFAKVFNVHRAVSNPWCLSTATLSAGGTVEDCLLRSIKNHSCSRAHSMS